MIRWHLLPPSPPPTTAPLILATSPKALLPPISATILTSKKGLQTPPPVPLPPPPPRRISTIRLPRRQTSPNLHQAPNSVQSGVHSRAPKSAGVIRRPGVARRRLVPQLHPITGNSRRPRHRHRPPRRLRALIPLAAPPSPVLRSRRRRGEKLHRRRRRPRTMPWHRRCHRLQRLRILVVKAPAWKMDDGISA